MSTIDVPVGEKNKDDREKLRTALKQLMADDRTLIVVEDGDTGKTILKGTSELHLDIAVSRLKRAFGIELDAGAPQVAYRETISRHVELEYTHKLRVGDAAQFAKLTIDVTPQDPGDGFVFESQIADGVLPAEYIRSVERGVQHSMKIGPIAGFPVIDLKVTLTSGAFDESKSSTEAFERGARKAFVEAILMADPILLEPVMNLEVTTPEEFMGDVIGDLSSRRGRIAGTEPDGIWTVIRGDAPLSNLFGYVSQLRSMTGGRASCTMAFSHHALLPENVPPNDDPDNYTSDIGMRA